MGAATLRCGAATVDGMPLARIAGVTKPRSRAHRAWPQSKGHSGRLGGRTAVRDGRVAVRFVASRAARQERCARNDTPLPVMRTARRDTVKTNSGNGREALWQQRRHFVGMDGDECACRDGVAASHGATGQDGVDRQMQARMMPAATAVGDGRRDARTSHIALIPPRQMATDSHDYTRLVR